MNQLIASSQLIASKFASIRAIHEAVHELIHEAVHELIYICLVLRNLCLNRLALEDGVKVSKQGVHNFLERYAVCGNIDRKAGSGFPSKITPAINCIIKDAMHCGDKTTATEIQSILATHGVWLLQHGQGIKWDGSIEAQHTTN